MSDEAHEPGERPTVRLLHHLARTGGTVISRCLAAMRRVTLLSEIHPGGAAVAAQFDPLFQAQFWYKLVTDDEADMLRSSGASLAELIVVLAERAAARGEHLVVREWSHLDWVGAPYGLPTERMSLAESLAPICDLRQAVTVRHPAAQWLSWRRYRREGDVSLPTFMAGCRKFAEHAVLLGFQRYEDLTADPGPELGKLCGQLELPYDDGWFHRWFFIRSVTGDVGSLDRFAIEPVLVPALEEADRGALEDSADYGRVLELLGYEHPPLVGSPEAQREVVTI